MCVVVCQSVLFLWIDTHPDTFQYVALHAHIHTCAQELAEQTAYKCNSVLLIWNDIKLKLIHKNMSITFNNSFLVLLLLFFVFALKHIVVVHRVRCQPQRRSFDRILVMNFSAPTDHVYLHRLANNFLLWCLSAIWWSWMWNRVKGCAFLETANKEFAVRYIAKMETRM